MSDSKKETAPHDSSFLVPSVQLVPKLHPFQDSKHSSIAIHLLKNKSKKSHRITAHPALQPILAITFSPSPVSARNINLRSKSALVAWTVRQLVPRRKAKETDKRVRGEENMARRLNGGILSALMRTFFSRKGDRLSALLLLLQLHCKSYLQRDG